MQPFLRMCDSVEKGKRNKSHWNLFHGTPGVVPDLVPMKTLTVLR